MLRSICGLAALALALVCAPACTGGPGGEGTGGAGQETGGAGQDGSGSEGRGDTTTTCDDFAGTWALIGGCPETSCDVTQADC